MATSQIGVTQGSGKNMASNAITEDALIKELQRIVLNDSAGVELTGNIGALTETAPGTDTALSGLNGRLQRIAQNLTSYLGANSGAAVVTDANGTLQQYLRGLVKIFITAGSAFVSSLVAPNANEVRGQSGAVTGTTSTQIIAAQGAGQKIYLTTIIVTNSHATVGTLVTIQDDAGSPIVLCSGYAAALGGGFVATFPTPPSTTANQKLMVICGTTGANVYASAVGFKGA